MLTKKVTQGKKADEHWLMSELVGVGNKDLLPETSTLKCFGETIISQVKSWNHPTETNIHIQKTWLLRVPGLFI